MGYEDPGEVEDVVEPAGVELLQELRIAELSIRDQLAVRSIAFSLTGSILDRKVLDGKCDLSLCARCKGARDRICIVR